MLKPSSSVSFGQMLAIVLNSISQLLFTVAKHSRGNRPHLLSNDLQSNLKQLDPLGLLFPIYFSQKSTNQHHSEGNLQVRKTHFHKHTDDPVVLRFTHPAWISSPIGPQKLGRINCNWLTASFHLSDPNEPFWSKANLEVNFASEPYFILPLCRIPFSDDKG